MRRFLAAAAAAIAIAAVIALLIVGLHGTALSIFFGVLLACCAVSAVIAWLIDRRAQRALAAQVDDFKRDRTGTNDSDTRS